MKTTLDLPDELVREMKLRAVVQGRTIKDLVTELLSHGLGIMPHGGSPEPRESNMVELTKDGLPMIRCLKKAPASRMSAQRLLKLEQQTQLEEDLHRGRLPD